MKNGIWIIFVMIRLLLSQQNVLDRKAFPVARARFSNLATDEIMLYSISATQSLMFFWLKRDWAVTNQRIAWRAPKTILRMIPIGSREKSYSLTNVSEVSPEAGFSIRKMMLACFFLLIAVPGIAMGGGWETYLGGFFLVLGLIELVNSYRFGIRITLSDGHVVRVYHTIFDRKNLEQFCRMAQSQLYTEYDFQVNQMPVDLPMQQRFAASTQHFAATSEPTSGISPGLPS